MTETQYLLNETKMPIELIDIVEDYVSDLHQADHSAAMHPVIRMIKRLGQVLPGYQNCVDIRLAHGDLHGLGLSPHAFTSAVDSMIREDRQLTVESMAVYDDVDTMRARGELPAWWYDGSVPPKVPPHCSLDLEMMILHKTGD